MEDTNKENYQSMVYDLANSAFISSGYAITEKTLNTWDQYKLDKDFLRWAIAPVKNKTNTATVLNSFLVSLLVLYDRDNIDETIVDQLLNVIYTNKDIARFYLRYNGYTLPLLLIALGGSNKPLTDEQKGFTVSEALRHNGAINSNNDEFTYYTGDYFDLRYQILTSNDWTIEEKEALINDFWVQEEKYEEVFEGWSWNIINNNLAFDKKGDSQLDITQLLYYDYETVLALLGNKKADKIWPDIMFIQTMHDLRKPLWEKDVEQRLLYKMVD